ncbi:hypothetical protein [Janthinobacterium sp. HH01]|uniref:hypothetical protein n=1 Tax=Janthinobacterium sp. HH01 TaxID=1198452 RepID=UPI000A0333BC|nr:hypothetical protein [Janthinobacterium sp. HH01]
MSNQFFLSVKKILPAPAVEVTSAVIEKNLSTNALPGMQRLTADEYLIVAGGPEVENEPQR